MSGLVNAVFLAPQLKGDTTRESCYGHRYRPEDGDDEKNLSLIVGDDAGALAATITEGTPVIKIPIAIPVSSVRRLFDCAGCTGCSRDTGPRRASTRAVISRSTRSRKDSITASLYSGPSSLCAPAAARISCGESGDVLMGESPPEWPRPRPMKDKIHLVTELVSAGRVAALVSGLASGLALAVRPAGSAEVSSAQRQRPGPRATRVQNRPAKSRARYPYLLAGRNPACPHRPLRRRQ